MPGTAVYCGPAPEPSTLMGAWNPDAVAMSLCASLFLLWLWKGRRDRGASLWGGIAVLAVLFVSPLCALTAALFSIRSLHHILLIAVAAPMLVLAMPVFAATRQIGIGWLVAIQALVLWFWHVPPVYSVAIAQPLAYWIMQSSLLVTALLFWQRVLDPRVSAAGAVLGLLGTSVQMGMLGALLTFATVALYEPHLQTTLPFGLSALQDQQLAGIIMWVPAALPYLAAALLRAWPLLGPTGSARWSG